MGRLELMMPVLASIFVLGLIVWVKWRLRTHPWFWLTIAMLVALHIAMICLVPWTKKWVPATTSAGIASVDVWAMLGIISIVGHLCSSDV